MHATAIDHVNLGFPADRLEEVIEFYVDRLGFETGFDDPHAAVRDDPGLFAIELGGGPRLYVRPVEEFDADRGSYRHVAIRIDDSPEAVRSLLEDAAIEIGSTAERERESVGSYTSYYVTDPFGYTVEFMAVGG
ncbi:VOC family protein [Natrononativus amylolyticus]|uniref:VOC family protein n=1 Tax=Natrononativus amylolyticus TaxID=2963434 RepID=UPI0020CBCFF0|nr:VOC family protein [Natrononativus amylolyticus]